jgi:hypothetical protein
MIGLASTGLVAAVAFYVAKDYIVKPWVFDSQPILL